MGLIKGFTPNWFTVGMGTGILALDAYAFPNSPAWVKGLGIGLALINMVIVALLLALIALKGVMDRPGFRKVVNHPAQSMFFGAIPMALTTVVNAVVNMGMGFFPNAALHWGIWLWLINVALAVGSGIGVPFWMFTQQKHALTHMTAIWLMPIVPAEVVAASGTLLLPHVASLAVRQDLFITVVALWAMSVPMAFLLLGILFLRLVLHKLPPQNMAISTWITLGTLGTGVMGLVGIARDSGLVFPQFGHGLAGAALLTAAVLWGLGIWWMIQSVLITGYYLVTRRLRFNLGWWGLTFPLGVFGGGTDLLYESFGTSIFHWAAMVFFALLAIFWVVVATFTGAHLRILSRHSSDLSLTTSAAQDVQREKAI